MRKFLFVICLLFIFTTSVKSSSLDDYVGQGYSGYMGKYFLNDKEKLLGADIAKTKQNGLYILERDFEKQTHILYVCNDILKQTETSIFMQCLSLAIDGYIFIKLELAEMENEQNQMEKVIYVSIGDDKTCIEKYTSPISFEKHCNPKENKDITYLKLYNVYVD